MSSLNTMNNDKELLICPDCKKDIPIISLVQYKGKVCLDINCLCSNQTRTMDIEEYFLTIQSDNPNLNPNYNYNPNLSLNHSNTEEELYCTSSRHHKSNHPAVKYCCHCQSWLCQDCLHKHNKKNEAHLLLSRELQLTCKQHRLNEYELHCSECNKSACRKCKDKSHQNHQLEDIKIISPEYFMQLLTEFESFEESNREMKETYFNCIDAKISQLAQWKNDIESSYESNMRTQTQLVKLIQLILNTIESIHTVKNYSIMKIADHFIINKEKIVLDYNDLDKCYSIFKVHLTNNYPIAIRRKPRNEYIALLQGHKNWIKYLFQLRDGRLLSCSNEAIKIWDVTSYKCLATIDSKEQNLFHSMTQLNDGRLASGSKSALKLWDLATYQCTFTLNGYNNWVICLLQLKDGRLASPCNQLIKLWDIATFQICDSIQGHSDSVSRLIQLKDERLVSISEDKTIKIWNIKSLQCITTLKGYSENISHMTQLNNGKLATCSLKAIMLWNINSFECEHSLIEGHKDWIHCIIEMKDGRLVTSSQDKSIKIWEVPSLKYLFSLEGNKCDVYCLTQLTDGRLITGCFDSTIKVWDI